MKEKTGYQGNILLKSTNTPHEWSKEEVQEYLKCKDDPVYFAENHCQIIHVDRGLIPYKPYDYQKELIKKLHDNRFVIGMQSRQTGKCFSDDTEITVRNKNTGEVIVTTVGDFYKKVKENGSRTD